MRGSTLLLRRITASRRLLFASACVIAFLVAAPESQAAVQGLTGPSFQLDARAGYISTPDGGSIYTWGYGVSGAMQYPAPTLIVNVGDTVSVGLTNALPLAAGNVSIVFQGHDVTATGGVAGLLTQEAPPGGTVTYSFLAANPGTYVYQSGTRADLQVEMGLSGVLIVNSATAACAYDHPSTCYDQEYLYALSEVDLDVHRQVEAQVGGPGPIDVATSPYEPEYWFINGRCAPDTMAMDLVGELPNQPYSAMTRMVPGERLLLRIAGLGRQMHPFHTHGNHARLLARDGRLVAKPAPVLGDPAVLTGPLHFTITSIPGGTADAIFEWTGRDLGWDIYGHEQDVDNAPTGDFPGAGDVDHNGNGVFDSVPLRANEWAADHGKPLPVRLPELQQLTFGGFWTGSPFLGVMGSLPPGEGGLNPTAGYTYMWHSHTEREMINNDIFPGGMMTMLVIEAPAN